MKKNCKQIKNGSKLPHGVFCGFNAKKISKYLAQCNLCQCQELHLSHNAQFFKYSFLL